jgi:hypothetical protein
VSNGFVIPAKEDRYEVTSISGYIITPDCHTLDTNGKKWRTEWYVVDRFDACNIYRVCRTEDMARKLAHLMNRRERRWEVTGED